jgi:outer membrane protein TolC
VAADNAKGRSRIGVAGMARPIGLAVAVILATSLPASGKPKGPPAGPPVLSGAERVLTLEDCLRIARSSNLGFKLAQADYAKAQSAHYGSTGRFVPVALAERTREDTRETAGIPGADSTTKLRGDVLTAGLDQLLPSGARVKVVQDLNRDFTPIRASSFSATVTQPLLRGGGWLAAVGPVTSARLELESSEWALAAAERDMVLATTLAYLAAVRDRSLIGVAEGALQADSLLVQASGSLVAARMATRRDVLSAELRLADDKAALVGAERDHALSLDRLKEEMGVAIESPIRLAEVQLADTTLELDEASLVRDALSGHPALQSAEASVRRGEVDWKLARNAQLPRVDLVGTYTRSIDKDLGIGQTVNSGRGWLTAVQVSLPVVNREAQASADIARLSLEQDRHRLTLLRLRTQRSVREALRTLKGISEELQAVRQTIALAQEKVEFATAMFNLGRASNLDLTDAREALVKGRSDYVRKLADYHAQLAVLKSLTGRELMP